MGNSRLMQDLKLLFSAHYITNILLAVAFVFCKLVSPFCIYLFPKAQCELEFRENQVLIFMVIIIGTRTRRRGTTTMLPYISTICKYTKIGNLFLFFYSDPRLGLIYLCLCILHLVFLPEPVYEGPDNILYFRDTTLEEELQQDTRVNWLVTFYAPWNPNCVNFAPVFAQLSLKYHLENLRFGKIDISRYPAAAEKYKINTSPFSVQLPTVILFKNGKPVSQRPAIDPTNGRPVKFFCSELNIISAFDLNNLYQHCKANPIKHKKAIAAPNGVAPETNHVKSE